MRAIRLVLPLVAATLSAGIAPARAADTVVVTNRMVYPGETIAVGALEEVEMKRAPAARGEIARQVRELEGKVAKRTLLPNRMIPLAAVRDPWLVERGREAEVVFASGALTISLKGVPLESGAAGDLIKVRNVDSGAVFSGTVMADGTIRVGAS